MPSSFKKIKPVPRFHKPLQDSFLSVPPLKTQAKFQICPSCSTEQPLSEFYSDPARKNRVDIYCKTCRQQKQKYYRHSVKFNEARNFWQSLFNHHFFQHVQFKTWESFPNLYYSFLLQIPEASRIYYLLAFNEIYIQKYQHDQKYNLKVTIKDQLSKLEKQFSTPLLESIPKRKEILNNCFLYTPPSSIASSEFPCFIMNGINYKQTIADPKYSRHMSFYTPLQYCSRCKEFKLTYSQYCTLHGMHWSKGEYFDIYNPSKIEESRENFNALILGKLQHKRLRINEYLFKRSNFSKTKWAKRCKACTFLTEDKNIMPTDISAAAYTSEDSAPIKNIKDDPWIKEREKFFGDNGLQK